MRVMQPSPLSLASTWDLVADDYALEIAPVFRSYALRALELVELREGMRVLDVAAGPGTLSLLAASRRAEVEAIDFSPRMIARLEQAAARDKLSNLRAQVGDGQRLALPDGRFDAAFSMFGLMFFPDRAAGFRELLRVLARRGRAVVSSWQPLTPDSPLQVALGTLAELTSPENGAGAAGARLELPLASPDVCRREMEEAGFCEVTVHEVVGYTEAPSVSDMVLGFVRSSAPFALTRQRYDGDAWARIEAQLIAKLTQRLGDGPVRLDMPAYLTLGRL